MKITDDMLTEMEPIVSQWIRERGTCMDGASYAAALEPAAYVAGRRTTPDREAISDHDAKGLEIIAGWLDKEGLVEPAAMLRRIAGRPTAPTSDKGGA